MSKSLPVSKIIALSKSLSGKETALLVIDYQLKGRDESKDYENEIDSILASMRYDDPKKRIEYSFYYNLWRNVGFYSIDLQSVLKDIEIHNWQMTSYQHLIIESAFRYRLSQFINFLPTIYSKEDFELAYEECQKDRFEDVIPLELLAEFEAFEKLRTENLVHSDCCYGVTEILDEDNELKQIWRSYKDSIISSLEQAIKIGDLIEQKVKEKYGWYHCDDKYIGTIGITGKSWYDYTSKLDKLFNKSIDDKEGLVEFSKGNFAIAVGMSAYKGKTDTLCSAERHKLGLKDLLLQDVHISEKDGVVTIDSEAISIFKSLVNKINELIEVAVKHREVITYLQSNLFDNKIELGDQAIKRVKPLLEIINNPINELEEYLKELFKPTSPNKESQIKDFENLRINITPEISKEVINEECKLLISFAEKESGYRWIS